jgi:23S rRNA pseudouridine1911/1915/1917 synthase
MHESATTFQFIADRGDSRLRLDRILVRRVTDVSRLSRNVVQQWIASAAVTVDGHPVTRSAGRVREGAAISVRVPPGAVLRVRPEGEPLPLTIVYEDDALLVVDKPAGIVVHPTYKQTTGTLLNGVLWHLRNRPRLQPGIVTRLDKDTSGLVLVALAPDVHAWLQRRRERVEKEYLAIVHGRPEPECGTIDTPIGRDASDRRRMIVTPDGAPSLTRYERLATQHTSSGPVSLVRCELLTGRTHQIRVHLASNGWPVVGDRTYGTADPSVARQALHASRLTVVHPRTGEPVTVRASLPAEMRAAAAWMTL